MNIDHIGILVKSLDVGIEKWKNVFGYKQYTEIVTNTRQKVNVVFMEKDNSLPVKLISPVDRDSPVYVAAQRGGGLHHICFKCDEIESEVEFLETHGMRVLAGPEPGEAFANENIVFLFAKQGLNIELIDTNLRAKIISE